MKDFMQVQTQPRKLRTRLKQVLLRTLKDQASKNLPLVYRDKFCVKRNQFIHKYDDGRKYLIQQDRRNSIERIIREF